MKKSYPKNRKSRPRKSYCKYGHLRIPENLRGWQCKVCCRINQAKAYWKSPAVWNERNRNAELKQNFGITIDGYNKMLKDQNFSCAICSRPESAFKVRLAVDHDHFSKRIRGLVCLQCNTVVIPAVEKYSYLLNVVKDYLNERRSMVI